MIANRHQVGQHHRNLSCTTARSISRRVTMVAMVGLVG